VLAIPSTQHYRAGWRKWLLRRATAGIVPESIRWRKDKTNFLPFLALGLQQKEVAQVIALLEAPFLRQLGIVKPDELRSAYDGYLGMPPETVDAPLWYCITLELWLQHHRQMLFGEELVATGESKPGCDANVTYTCPN
jgi:asparagine synthase (glutamine-hydrolysing)